MVRSILSWHPSNVCLLALVISSATSVVELSSTALARADGPLDSGVGTDFPHVRPQAQPGQSFVDGLSVWPRSRSSGEFTSFAERDV